MQTDSVSSLQRCHNFIILPEESFLSSSQPPFWSPLVSCVWLFAAPWTAAGALYLISIPAPMTWTPGHKPPPVFCCPSFLLPLLPRSTPPSSLSFLFFLPPDHNIYLFQSSSHSFFFFLILFFLNFILFKFTILYWFCHISKWICHRYTCVSLPEPSSLLPPHTLPLGRPSAPAPSLQYHASNLD